MNGNISAVSTLPQTEAQTPAAVRLDLDRIAMYSSDESDTGWMMDQLDQLGLGRAVSRDDAF